MIYQDNKTGAYSVGRGKYSIKILGIKGSYIIDLVEFNNLNFKTINEVKQFLKSDIAITEILEALQYYEINTMDLNNQIKALNKKYNSAMNWLKTFTDENNKLRGRLSEFSKKALKKYDKQLKKKVGK